MKLPFAIYDLRFTIREESAGGTGVAPVESGVAPDLGRDRTTGIHKAQSGFTLRAGFGRDARNNRRDACSTRLGFNPPCSRTVAAGRQSSIINHKSQSGVALVLTLILLSVALVMTLAFLAISGREQGSVTTQTDTATTRLAADAGLAAAEAQITANILSTTNPYSFDLIVSTNYINTAGFQSGVANFINVNYYDSAGNFLAGNNFLQNLENLFYSPRPPVFISQNGTNDFRYYLDLNRNGVDDPAVVINGTVSQFGDPEWIGVLERPDLPYGPNNPFIARYAFIAMPVGNSLDLNAIHNQALSFNRTTKQSIPIPPDYYARNQGVGSWEINLAAFLTDLNTNEWDPIGDQYNYIQPLKNSSGNLIWGNSPNSGRGFEDAFVLLTNRYAGLYATLPGVNTLFGTAGDAAFANDFVDGYSDGPLMTGTRLPAEDDNPYYFWPGADNTNHFFTPEELFDPTKTFSFSTNLFNAGTLNSTYDRYTFYRMLAQLGTDTTPESGRMNLNYDNLDPYVFVGNGIPVYSTNGVASETNFVSWQPLGFFNNAADRMLRAYTTAWFQGNPTNYFETYYGVIPSGYLDASGVGVTNLQYFGQTNQIPAFGVENIPVQFHGSFVYTPAVQRVLQLAANLYDASTTNRFPSVFRPLFLRDTNNNLYVSGYAWVPSVTGVADTQLAPPVDATALAAMPGAVINLATNVYGVPWIIGAKKGFPNFNEFVQENAVGITRRLQLTRDTNSEAANYPKIYLTGTNQMYILNLNSSMGLDFWNSYNSNFLDNVTVAYRVITWMNITNFDGNPTGVTQPMGFSFANANSFSVWPGTSPWSPSVQNGGSGQPNPGSFFTPLYVPAYPVLTNSVYRTGNASLTPGTLPSGFIAPCLIPVNYFGSVNMTTLFETSATNFSLPHFVLLTTNQLQVFILDGASGNYHVIDYAHFEQNSSRDLNAEIFTDGSNNVASPEGIWNTNINPRTGAPYGIENQILISRGQSTGTGVNGQPPTEDGTWQPDAEAPQYGGAIQAQQAYFQAFLQPYGAIANISDHYGQASASNIAASVQAPYAPTRYGVGYTILQANDPLVHYLASDLTPSFDSKLLDLPPIFNNFYTNELVSSLNLGSLNFNYQPWGGNPVLTAQTPDPNAYNLAERDPLVSQSDYWNFPTNKFPTTGWMGRVHRGTPWQTVYLKSPAIDPNTWAQWTGDKLVAYNQFFDAGNSAPVTDRLLFDLFTTAFNDNATRGTLSVNQSADSYDPDSNPAAGLAAWSALFSGMVVAGPTNSYSVIAPVGGLAVANSSLGILVTNINYTRYNFKNTDGLVGVFEHEGDILSVPQLTDKSPFLDSTQTGYNSDAMYEWLPQQAMSLLRVGAPRYVIYSYGQALKPAPNGVYLSSDHFGMVTNYQIMSEMATRAVVRLDTARTNAIGANGAIIVTPPRAVIESFNILPPD
jgi:hypothetical protein